VPVEGAKSNCPTHPTAEAEHVEPRRTGDASGIRASQRTPNFPERRATPPRTKRLPQTQTGGARLPRPPCVQPRDPSLVQRSAGLPTNFYGC
jgi:hypothetical protein